MLELTTVLALSGMLAMASAASPADDLNTVCFPSGQLKNTIPYPCPGIGRAKDICHSKFPIASNPSPEQLRKHRDCICFDEKLIQFEKGCTSCKQTHAFLSKMGKGYWDGILDNVYEKYCKVPTPTAGYDAMWASASQVAGGIPTGGPDDELVNSAATLPADEKTKVELYWQGTTEEVRPTMASVPTSVLPGTSATATSTASGEEDEDECVEETTASQGSVASATSGSIGVMPTPVLNNDWIYCSAKEDASASLQPSTARPAQPSQSAWTDRNQTAPNSPTVVVVGQVVIVRVCQKCVYVRTGDDYKVACGNPMQVEGTKKEIPAEKAKDLPVVPKDLPKEPVSVEQKKEITIADVFIQQVCQCSYTSDAKTPGSGSNGSNGSEGSKTPGSGAGSNGSEGSKTPGSEGSKTPGSGSNGSEGSKTPGSGSNGSEGSKTPGSGSNGSTGSEGSKTPSSGSNGSTGSEGSKTPGSGSGSNGSEGSKTPGSGSNGSEGSKTPGAGSGSEGSKTPGSGAGSIGSEGSKTPTSGSNGAGGPKGVSPPGSLASNSPIGSKNNGTVQHPIVSSASGNMPASMALFFLAAVAILI